MTLNELIDLVRDDPPKLSDWIDWKGGKRPVDSSSYVDVILRDGTKSKSPILAASLYWVHMNSGSDIVKYRPCLECLTKPLDRASKQGNLA